MMMVSTALVAAAIYRHEGHTGSIEVNLSRHTVDEYGAEVVLDGAWTSLEATMVSRFGEVPLDVIFVDNLAARDRRGNPIKSIDTVVAERRAELGWS